MDVRIKRKVFTPDLYGMAHKKVILSYFFYSMKKSENRDYICRPILKFNGESQISN